MKIACISDVHDVYHKIEIPECDVLVCAGDWTGNGGPGDVVQFIKWFCELPAPSVKIAIAGNHDFFCEKFPEVIREEFRLRSSEGNECVYLDGDEYIHADGTKFYGSPVTPRFFDWAFNVNRGNDIAKHWQRIPDDTDVLITHGPPLGVLDVTGGRNQEAVGCWDLKERVMNMELKAHIFGHIHHSYGTMQVLGLQTQFVNACICDETYRPTRKPIVIEI